MTDYNPGDPLDRDTPTRLFAQWNRANRRGRFEDLAGRLVANGDRRDRLRTERLRTAPEHLTDDELDALEREHQRLGQTIAAARAARQERK